MSRTRRPARKRKSRAGGKRRSAARLAAVQALYEMDMVGAPADTVLAEFMSKRWRQGAADGAGEAMAEPEGRWLADLVNGVAADVGGLDRMIAGALSPEAGVDRLEPLLRGVLRAGVFELTAKPKVPAAVVIDEYVEVANAFFDGKEAALVNGVLDRLAREIRSGEF